MALESPGTHAEQPLSLPRRMMRLGSDFLLSLAPEWLKGPLKSSLMDVVLPAMLIFVMAPPLAIWLTAFYLNKLADAQVSWVQTFRTAYIAYIQDAFSIEEVAARSNQRLDYLQVFSLDIKTVGAAAKTVQIFMQRGQRAELTFNDLRLVSDSPELQPARNR
ncbi:MAG: hypothetical protein QM742_04700 [Aquabacterium sp.]